MLKSFIISLLTLSAVSMYYSDVHAQIVKPHTACKFKSGYQTICGTLDSDTLQGKQTTKTKAVFYGLEGDDTISGNWIDLAIANPHGNHPTNLIYAGAGDDQIFPGVGALNTVYGGPGDDQITPSPGLVPIPSIHKARYKFYGEGGNDTLTGVIIGNVIMDGGPGDDLLVSTDSIFGFGNETITAGSGNDSFLWVLGIPGGNKWHPGDDVITDYQPGETLNILQLCLGAGCPLTMADLNFQSAGVGGVDTILTINGYTGSITFKGVPVNLVNNPANFAFQ